MKKKKFELSRELARKAVSELWQSVSKSEVVP
jgi:hypothetical protein